METVPNHPLLKLSREDIDAVRNFYEIEDTKRISESLDAIEVWVQKQAHLVEASTYMTRDYIERLFIIGRASTENTKKKIDKLFTARSLMPEICLNKTIGEFDNIFDSVKFTPLPIICPGDRTRVMVTQLEEKNIDEFSLLTYFRYSNMIGEYRLHYDYVLGDRYVIDMNHATVISKINPVLLKKADSIAEAYGTKIKGVHILNAPSFMDAFVRLLKQTLREKVASRLHVHSSYEDLYKHIPREVLPEDYGGPQLPIAKLCEQWKEHLKTEKASRLVNESDKLISDETKRNSSDFNQEYMGMPGSFRKLIVD